jgi:hypothetical protein
LWVILRKPAFGFVGFAHSRVSRVFYVVRRSALFCRRLSRAVAACPKNRILAELAPVIARQEVRDFPH